MGKETDHKNKKSNTDYSGKNFTAFIKSILHITKEKGIKLEKIIKEFGNRDSGELRTAVLNHLEDHMEASAPPAWIVIETPGQGGEITNESLFHFASPMFTARAMDFHEHDNLLIDRWLSAVRLGPDGSAELFNGRAEDFDEEKRIKINDSNLSMVDSYFTDGEVVFAFFNWIEHAPAASDDFKKLMKAADDAYHGEINAYDADEYRKPGQPGRKNRSSAVL